MAFISVFEVPSGPRHQVLRFVCGGPVHASQELLGGATTNGRNHAALPGDLDLSIFADTIREREFGELAKGING